MEQNSQIACRPKSYRFIPCDVVRNCHKISSATHAWTCPIHTTGCLGHLETDNNATTVLMPSLDLNGLRELLKKDEVRCWSGDEQMRGSGFTTSDVVSFLPKSEEMMSVLSDQERIIAEKHG